MRSDRLPRSPALALLAMLSELSRLQNALVSDPMDQQETDQASNGDSATVYANAKSYWGGIETTVNGMLGGFSHLSSHDVADSRKFLRMLMNTVSAGDYLLPYPRRLVFSHQTTVLSQAPSFSAQDLQARSSTRLRFRYRSCQQIRSPANIRRNRHGGRYSIVSRRLRRLHRSNVELESPKTDLLWLARIRPRQRLVQRHLDPMGCWPVDRRRSGLVLASMPCSPQAQRIVDQREVGRRHHRAQREYVIVGRSGFR